MVPHEHGLRLIDAWAGEKQVVHIPGSDHFDIQLSAHSWQPACANSFAAGWGTEAGWLLQGSAPK